jgi:pullulanase/glycogen debranching enzyme
MAYELKHRTTKTIEKGKSFPLGATLASASDGVNFAVYSKHATEVFLLLFAGIAKLRSNRPPVSTAAKDTLLDFLQTTYEAATDLAKWDPASLEGLKHLE